MRLFSRFLYSLLVAILLIPLSVAAEEVDQKDYSDLFSNGTFEERKQAFTEDPHSFISALSEEKYGRMITVIGVIFTPGEVEKTATPISRPC